MSEEEGCETTDFGETHEQFYEWFQGQLMSSAAGLRYPELAAKVEHRARTTKEHTPIHEGERNTRHKGTKRRSHS